MLLPTFSNVPERHEIITVTSKNVHLFPWKIDLSVMTFFQQVQPEKDTTIVSTAAG